MNVNNSPRYVIYKTKTDGSGNIFLNTAKDGYQLLGVFPLSANITIQSVGYYEGAYYAFCKDFGGGDCANRDVTVGVLYKG